MSDASAVDLNLLTVEQKEYAANNLNETDEIRGNKIEEIRQWILNSEDLCARTGIFELVLFYLKFRNFCKS